MTRDDEALAVLRTIDGEQAALTAVHVRGWLRELMAEVEVEQHYLNPEQENIEAVYTFPLPIGATLLSLEVEIAGKKLAGTVVEKKQAERAYEEAVTDGDSAVMLEETAPGLYSANIGNLMAQETAVIRYRYGMLLSWQGDRLRFMLPTTIAPRYGNPAHAGIAGHLQPQTSLAAEYPLTLMLTLEGALATALTGSPSHLVLVERQEERLIVRLGDNAWLDRDFILTLQRPARESAAFATPDQDGFVALASLRIPPVGEDERRPLNLKLLIDCSGSMAGTSIRQARKAALAVLEQLRPADRFNVTLFGNGHEHLFSTLMPASKKQLAAARRRLQKLDADMGGTELGNALSAVVELGGAQGEQSVLLVTDGELWEHEPVVRLARRSGHRVFTVGVGMSSAEGLIRELARQTGGAWELVAPQEGMADRILVQFHRMRQRQVQACRLQWDREPAWSTPLPASLFAGDTVHVYAGFRDSAPCGAALVADTAAGAVTVAASVRTIDNAALPRLAAAQRLPLLDPADAAALALRYQLLSPWTNYLVLAERTDKAAELPQLHRVPQMLAAGWGGTGDIMASMDCIGDGLDISCEISQALHRPPASLPMFARAARSTGANLADAESVLRTPELFIAALELFRERPGTAFDMPDTIAMLEGCHLPAQVADRLRALVDDGHDEEEVVCAFLYGLTISVVGGVFNRISKRSILHAWKRIKPDAVLQQQVMEKAMPQSGLVWQ